MSHVELAWEDPGTAAFYRRLAGLGRLILFDKRDTGLSDRAPGDSPLEERMDDVQAVMNAPPQIGPSLFGYSEGAPMSILFAATYPEKVSSLILGSAFARWFPAPDYPCGARSEGGVRGDGRDRDPPLGPGRDDRLVLPQPVELPADAREMLGPIRAHGDQPQRVPAHDPDDPRNRRPRRAARDPRADAGDPAPRRPDQSRRSTAATSHPTSPAPATSSSPATTSCGSRDPRTLR